MHYQFWKNGRFVDPMTIKLPRNQKLSATEMKRFQANRDVLMDTLNGPAPVAMTDGAPEVRD